MNLNYQQFRAFQTFEKVKLQLLYFRFLVLKLFNNKPARQLTFSCHNKKWGKLKSIFFALNLKVKTFYYFFSFQVKINAD